MSDYAIEAARNYSIKEKYTTIDDPIAAINFAVKIDGDECQNFLSAWQCGAWAEIEDCYRKYLDHLPAPKRRRTPAVTSKQD